MSNNNNINTNNEKEKDKDSIKNLSVGQQLLEIKEQLRQTQIELREREAKIQAMTSILSQLFSITDSQGNKLFKELHNNISALSKMIGEPLLTELNQKFEQIDKLEILQIKQLSTQYRQINKLPVLDIDGDR